MTHPMDSVPVPPKEHFPCDNRHGYTADQLRSYGLSAYEMGRNEGLEEAAKECLALLRKDRHGYPTPGTSIVEECADAIKGLKR